MAAGERSGANAPEAQAGLKAALQAGHPRCSAAYDICTDTYGGLYTASDAGGVFVTTLATLVAACCPPALMEAVMTMPLCR